MVETLNICFSNLPMFLNNINVMLDWEKIFEIFKCFMDMFYIKICF